MQTAAYALTLVVAALHVGFMVLESILWTGPVGRKIFALSKEQAEHTKVLALNQGLYNAGIAALLAWATVTGLGATVSALLIFIVAMGIIGGVTAKWSIILTQAVPAAIALVLWHL